MTLETVTLKIPRELLSGAQRVATARDVTIGHMVRQLLKREVARQLSAHPGDAPDGRLLIALQALLARDLAAADGWDDVAERLRPHGYALKPAAGGLTLVKTSCGTRICKLSDLGVSDATFAERFGGPMPDAEHCAANPGVMPAGRIDPTRAAMLTRHMAEACSWPELVHRLAVEGMELRPLGAALGIYVSATGRHLCNSSTVGAPCSVLVARFGPAIPGQPHAASDPPRKAAGSA